METEKPKVEYRSESETYVIQVGEISIYIKYGADGVFNWTKKSENSIHQDKIQVIESD